MINKIEKLLQEARTHVAVEVNNTLPRTYKEIGKLLVEDIDLHENEEIYDVMKENQPYDEKRYAQALRNMVQQCIDYEDTHEILTEWDEWDNLVQEGYEAQYEQNYEKMIPLWWKAWGIFQKFNCIREESISKRSMPLRKWGKI